jgi:hypothetical protein
MLYLRSFNRFILISFVLLGLSVSSVNAATYVLAGAFGSELQGANGVTVGGQTYNVSFLDGTCISVFDGCDQVSDFAFNTVAEAEAASKALLVQVFNAGDVYDTTPVLTRGVDPTIFLPNRDGEVLTPYGFRTSASVSYGISANNRLGEEDSAECFFVDQCFTSISASLLAAPNDKRDPTWALWTQVSAVPVPAAVWLFGTALVGFVGLSRRRKVA